LKNITVQFPLQALTVVCGVSGSGKTTLVKKILCRAILKANNIYNDAIHLTESVVYGGLKGDFKTIKSLEIIDQNSIGRNSRSTPISYIKGYDAIRNLFAQTKLAKSFKFFPSHFSFNVEGGRCESCQGEGFQTIEMQFMSDIKIRCEVCNGKKFKKEILDVKYNNKNIDEVLNLTVDEALDFFKDLQDIYHSILPLQNVGLGYIKLGQSISTVSGGEAQRIKLASFLSKTNQSLNPILFIFDEPTTGLHQYDTLKLLTCFDKLIQNGHSVICIEHNTQVINYADWVIEIGPEGGDAGGYLLYEGDLAGIHNCSKSVTKKYLTN
ncbi:MAG: ATP-binding cassette domain-containing protein, partial [Limnohabitans sp.]|nr:ATP-binding cassette domain-containing protein [Limnohabitans sp.]